MTSTSAPGLRRTCYLYCTELAPCENTVLAFDPINRTVPTTITRITARATSERHPTQWSRTNSVPARRHPPICRTMLVTELQRMECARKADGYWTELRPFVDAVFLALFSTRGVDGLPSFKYFTNRRQISSTFASSSIGRLAAKVCTSLTRRASSILAISSALRRCISLQSSSGPLPNRSH